VKINDIFHKVYEFRTKQTNTSAENNDYEQRQYNFGDLEINN